MGVLQAQATINETDPDVLAEAERLSTNGWVEPRKESAANDTARLSLAKTETRTVTLGAGINARERTFTVERKGPKVCPLKIREAMAAAAAKNQNPVADKVKIQRPSVESLFDKFNQRGSQVITMGNPEREVTVKTLETRDIEHSREWEEPDTRIEGLLTLDR